MIIPRQTFETLEPGEYTATVQRIEPQEGQYGLQLRWTFRLVAPGEEHDGRPITAWCGPDLTPKSKLARWARALLGPDLDDAAALDTALLTGRPCRIILSTATASDGSERNRISEILAPRPSRRNLPVDTDRPWDAPATTNPNTATAPGPAPTPHDNSRPSAFAGPNDAITWGYAQGVFDSAAAALAEYNRVKLSARPASAAAMWQAWITRVEELKANGDNAVPF